MKPLLNILRRSEAGDEAEPAPQPERCLSCEATLEASRTYDRYRVCHACGFHFQLKARERLAVLLDPASFREADRGVTAIDPLSFTGRQSYRSRVIQTQRRTGLAEAALTGTGTLFGREVVVAVLDFSFLGGSIGVAAGERLARAFEKAVARQAPLITVFSTSGTRMQEGLLALMQIPRVAAIAAKLQAKGLPHISILADPTTGSAYAGLANLADFIIAEPNALVGYAALRVLQETEEQDLPAGAHTSESHLRHGLIDAIVPRTQMRDSVGLLLDVLLNDFRLSSDRRLEAHELPHTHRSAWQMVQLSRHEERPTARELIGHMTTAFIEIHGDRSGEDDPAVVAGIASLGGQAVMLIGQVQPHDRPGQEDGYIRASGFRKAKRAMDLAAKFQLPLITLIDTAGALPSLANEERGLGDAVTQCVVAMLEVPSPTVAVITGEGNSEAAVAMAAADRVLMLDNAIYEVIRPEDAAKILFQEPGRASEIAERLRLTSHDCLKLGVVDATVPEPGEGAHSNHAEAAEILRRAVLRQLIGIQRMRTKRRLDQRFERYRHTGSTRSWLRGTIERRLAHTFDRVDSFLARLRRRPGWRRRVDFGEHPDIPV